MRLADDRGGVVRGAWVLVCLVLAASCSDGAGGGEDDDENDAGESGTGGATGGSGGATGGTGGATGGTGGATGGSGGATGGTGGATGGTSGTGGAVSGAGGAVSGAGGAVGGAGGAVGGGAGTGGAAGGSAGAGGAVGGSAGVGGAAAGAGGSAGAAPTTCDAPWAVGADGFVRIAAVGGGCWHGYSFTGGDTGSTPMPADFSMCGAGCMLRLTGSVGPATEANAYAGIMFLGFNLKQEAGASAKTTVTPTGSALVITYTNASASPIVRFQIQSGSAAATRWCAPLTGSPATIPYASFNTQCWEGGAGVAYAKEPIDQGMIVVPGGAAAAPVDITLTSVTEM